MAKTPEKIIDNQMAKLKREYSPLAKPETYLKQVESRVRAREANKKHREFTEQMDLSAQDNHAKFERASFIVVGEGSKSSNEKYAEGYERIDWNK